ncbi:hypothetical protein FA15DRAFT_588176 [Coprinopsis marcescibilis]|uniref:Tubby C-terminal domain-containing protein n=1 Tax=Coprinopsis marcescibilis TaxID=230819 RepID=A0A5C3L1L5_COPMA|nr:hypothetical protein FA15DRAFT_588176 [Coprinopsis marcescibilis]
MATLNPYAGWTPQTSGSSSIPSIQGALPYIDFPGAREAQWVTFRFASQGGDIFNCVVVDPESHPRFSIVTSIQNGTRTTLLRDGNGGLAGRIEWSQQPVVELRTYVNNIPRQPASTFITRSTDGASKLMTLKGKTYQWTRMPQQGIIGLLNVSYNPQERLGALFKTADGVVCLSVSPTVVAEGLLDVAVLVTILFSSGAHIG